MSINKRAWLARLSLLGASIIWGSSFFILKGAVDFLPPATLMTVRFTVGALVLFFVFRRQVLATSARSFGVGMLIGFLLAAASLTQNIGLVYTTPGKNAFLTTVYCVIVPFLAWAFDRKRPETRRLLAAFLCVLGVGLVSLTNDFQMGLGDALSLLGGLLYALHILAIDRAGKTLAPVALCVAQFAGSALLQCLYALAFEGAPFAQIRFVLPQMLYLSLVVTAGGYLLQIVGQRYASPAAASIIMSLESVFGVLFSVLFYGEQLTPRLMLGFGVIFASVLLSEVDPPKRPNPV